VGQGCVVRKNKGYRRKDKKKDDISEKGGKGRPVVGSEQGGAHWTEVLGLEFNRSSG